MAGSAGGLRDFAAKSRDVALTAAVVGVVTGFSVALLERVTVDALLEHVLELPLWAIALAPTVGLLLAAGSLRFLARGAPPGISDAYIRNFHERGVDLDVRQAPGSVLASVVTIGFGGAMGLEGLAMYTGAAVGTSLQQRLHRLFRPADAKMLMVAGAAAGVAAIFKAPATGAVFALEVPFQEDLARRRLLPALVAAATGYLAFVAVNGTRPLFPVHGDPGFDARTLVGSIVIGLGAGLVARAFAHLIRLAKRIAATVALPVRVASAGATMAALFVICRLLTGKTLTLGPGYQAIEWARSPDRAIPLLLAVMVLRCLATGATIAGGGAGGLFVPLVVAGALLGRSVAGAVNDPVDSMYTVVGVAAFLGAGYRVPLAAVMFVAESTGRPGFVVPGLLAAVAADLVMGRDSVTAYQRPSDRLAPHEARDELDADD